MAINSPLERLLSIDLAFDMAIAPRFKDRIANRVNVLAQLAPEAQ
jgi:hypothetical protein